MTMILLAVLAGLLPLVHWAPKGGVVGWLLLLTGLAELALGTRQPQGRVRTAAIGSALLTSGAGLIFMANPLARYFSVANVVTIWLVLRGSWVLAMASLLRAPPTSRWLGLSGLTDLLLALVLAAGLPVAVLVVTLFGPTPYIVAKFSVILATSFLITGISYLAISRIAARPAAVRSG
jgi:hypothetical protein